MADRATHSISNSNSQGSKIMIADEDLLACDLMQYSLENEGYKVEVCHSAKRSHGEKPIRLQPVYNRHES